MENKTEQFRLYFLCAYNLSEIQKGIQCGHAALEYANKYSEDKDFKRFVNYDKTWIVLNGGTSNHQFHDQTSPNKTIYASKVLEDPNTEGYITGTMEQHWNFLLDNKINTTCFIEPDANNMMTAICFLVPNTVFNKKEFPDFDKWIMNEEEIDSIKKVKLREIYLGIAQHEDEQDLYKRHFNKWANFLGGEKFGQLRLFLNKFRLA